MIIRQETASDDEAITEVTIAAFATLEVSQQTEQHIIRALRRAGALTLSLVAEVDGRVVGHIAFSPARVSDGTPGWYALGPVSVLPEYQRRGIGGALIEEGLTSLERLGARGCALVGHPDYYQRFGFRRHADLFYEGVPQEAFVVLPLGGELPSGRVEFHEAFAAES